MSSSTGLKWQDKVKFQKIIDELQFVASDDIQRYKCTGCDRIAIYHYIAECDHVYCGLCHGKVHDKCCLAIKCDQKVVQIKQEKRFEEKVANLKVHCSFRKNGCQEDISLRNYSDHEQKCRYSTKNLLPKVYKEKDTDLQVDNQKLGNTIEYLQGKINQLEKQFAIFKTYQDQQEKVKHLEEQFDSFKTEQEEAISDIRSLKKKIKSTAKDVDKIKKNSEKEKDNTKALMSKYDEKVTSECSKLLRQLENQAAEQTEKMSILKKELVSKRDRRLEDSNGSQCTQYIWEIKEMDKFSKTWRDEIQESVILYSEPFLLNDTELQTKAKLVMAWPSPPVLDLEFTDHRISKHQTPFSSYKCSFSILDQSPKATKRETWRVVYPYFYSKADGVDFPLALLEGKGRCFLKNDSILVKIKFEPLQVSCKSYFSKTGRLLWKIDNYMQRKQDALHRIKKELYSKCFYSSEMGYRMVVVAGFYKAYLGIRLLFIKGEHDDFLKFWFPHRTNLYLFYHSTNEIEGKKLKSTYHANFASFDPIGELRYNAIENATYLRNDCLFLEITVESEELVATPPVKSPDVNASMRFVLKDI